VSVYAIDVSRRFSLSIAENRGVDSSNLSLGTKKPAQKAGFSLCGPLMGRTNKIYSAEQASSIKDSLHGMSNCATIRARLVVRVFTLPSCGAGALKFREKALPPPVRQARLAR
jgi:hypothetical protein